MTEPLSFSLDVTSSVPGLAILLSDYAERTEVLLKQLK